MKGKFFMWYKKWEFFLDNTIENVKKIPSYFPYIKSSFKKRPILFIGIIFLFVSLPIFYLVTIFNKSPEAAWFDDSFAYRVAFEIANRSNYTAKNTPYKIIIDTATLISAGKMRSDGADIRVVDGKGKVPRFQVELSTLNTSTTAIWFEGNINSKSSAIYYVYYGNSNARRLSFVSDIKSIATDNSYVETIDGFKYLNTTYHARVSNIYKNNVDLGVAGNYHHSTGYPSGWWDDRVFTRTILANGPLFVEIKMEDTNYGNYTSFGTNIKNFKNGFSEVRVYMNYSATTTDTLYYYLPFTSGTRNSVWVNSSGVLVDQSANSGTLNLSTLGEDWFGQRWTVSGYYGGTIINRNSADWTSGATSAQASYYQTNYSSALSKNSGESREIRYGIFAGDGGLSEMQEKGGTYGAYTTTLKTEEKTETPVAYWKFDEGVGNVAKNSIRNEKNGTINGATWLNEDQCVSGKCLYFDGVNDTVNVGTGTNYFPLNTFSLCSWVKTSGLAPGMNASGIFGLTYGLRFYLESTGRFVTGMDNGTSSTYQSSTDNLFDNKFHYLCLTYDGTNRYMYVDGVKKITAATTWLGTTRWPTNAFNIGRDNNDGVYYFKGVIDEPKLYNYARSDKQVLADYNAGLARQSSNSGISASLGSSSQSNLSNGLIAYYKMDEATTGVGATVFDLSGNNTNAYLAGTTSPTVIGGKYGNAKNFNGIDDRIVIPSYTNPTTATSVFAWFKKIGTPAGGFHIIFGPSYVEISIPDSTGQIRTGVTTNTMGRQVFNSGSGLTDGNWHFVGLVYDGSKLEAYIDGVKTGNLDVSGSLSSVVQEIGRYGSNSYVANGYIDEARIYGRALSPAEVMDLYESAPGPVGYWDFEEGVGSTVYDKSGNGNNGIFINSPTRVNGKYGKALSFNGTNNYINAGNNQKLNPYYSETIGAWVKLNTLLSNQNSAYPQIIGKRDVDTQRAYFLAFEKASSKLYWEIKDNAGTYHTLTSTKTNWNKNEWYYVTAVFNSSLSSNNTAIYINGVLDNKSTWSLSYIPQTTATTRIGGGNYYLNGSIDEIKLYDYARTQKQIIQDMNAGHPAGGSPVGSQVSWWSFDEGYSNIAYDSISKNNGTFGTGSSSPTWTNSGKYGKAVQFNNGNIGITMGNPTSLDMKNNNFTISNYYYGFDTGSNVIIEKRGTGLNGYLYSVNYPSAGNISIFLNDGGTQKVYTFTNANIQTNNWYHLVTTINRETNEGKLYKDGKFIQTLNISGTTGSLTSDGNFRVGYDLGGTTFNGMIDELKIYTSALTEDEVKIDYNRGQAMQFGSMSSGVGNTASSNAASQEYCVPGDTVNCAPPVGEYKFNEGVGSTAYDISGNNLDLPFVGSPKWVNGKSGKALNFNGSTDYLYNSSIRKTLPGSLTFEAWIRTKSTDSTKSYSGNAAQNVIGDSTGSVALGFGITGGKLQYNHYISSWNAFTGTTSINDGKWHHIAVSHISGSIVLYVDGRQEITGSLAYNGSSAYNIIGRGYSADHFTGDIDEVKIYNYVRTPAQIAWDYNRGEPITHYAFDECQGSVIHDKSSNRLDGNLNIGASGTQTSAGSCESSGTAWGNGTIGRYNSSLNFDGTDDYVYAPFTAFGVTTPFTMSVWEKTSSSFSYEPGIVGLGYYPVMVMQTNGKVRVWWYNGVSYPGITSSKILNDGLFHHIIMTYNGTVAKLYVDGIMESSLTSNVYAVHNGIYVANEHNNGAKIFNGQIDDVKVFNYALTDTQIKTLYNNGAVSFAP